MTMASPVFWPWLVKFPKKGLVATPSTPLLLHPPRAHGTRHQTRFVSQASPPCLLHNRSCESVVCPYTHRASGQGGGLTPHQRTLTLSPLAALALTSRTCSTCMGSSSIGARWPRHTNSTGDDSLTLFILLHYFCAQQICLLNG